MGSKVRCGDSLQAGSESDAGSRKWGTYTPTSLPQSQLVFQTLPTLASPQSSFSAPPLAAFHPFVPLSFFRMCLPSPWRCLRHFCVVKEKNNNFQPQQTRSVNLQDYLSCFTAKHRKCTRCPAHSPTKQVGTLRPKSLGGFKL